MLPCSQTNVVIPAGPGAAPGSSTRQIRLKVSLIAGFIYVGRVEFTFKIENNHLRVRLLFKKWSFYNSFYFWLLYNLFRSYPHNKLYKCLCQQYFCKKLGKNTTHFYNLLSNFCSCFSNDFTMSYYMPETGRLFDGLYVCITN